MSISAADFADTLRLLVPGFIMMKTFYLFGLRTKRSDAEWLIWSVVAAAPLQFATQALWTKADASSLVVSLPLAILGGLILAVAWQRLRIWWPWIAADQTLTAWDMVFQPAGAAEGRWLVVKTSDRKTYLGWAKYVASSLQTDGVDIFLARVQELRNGRYVDIPGITGLLLARSDIASISIIK